MDTNKIREALEQAQKVAVEMGLDGMKDRCEIALAELDKAQQPGNVLTDEEVERLGSEREAHLIDLGTDPQAANNDRIAFETGLIESRHYLAPAAGLTVEEVMEVVDKWTSAWVDQYVEFRMEQDLRARLTAAINAQKPIA